jgi:hypothetical protein
VTVLGDDGPLAGTGVDWTLISTESPALCPEQTAGPQGRSHHAKWKEDTLFQLCRWSLKQTGEFICLGLNYSEVKGLVTPFSLQ